MKQDDVRNSNVNTVTSCIKWPGGKSWLAPRLVPIIRDRLVGTYFEPFIGGGSVFLRLAPPKAILSDINYELVHFLNELARSPEEIVRHVWRWSNTRECYYAVRDLEPRYDVTAAAKFLYLNRTCWGGVYRTNRRGEFNVPFGNSGRVICRRKQVLACSKLFATAKIVAMDFEESMAKAKRGDVVYVDPPYTTKGQNNGFIRYNEHLFSWNDQVRLASSSLAAAKRGVFVAVSGLWHQDLLRLYPGWWAMKMSRASQVSRIVASRGLVDEVVMLSRKPSAHLGVGEIVRLPKK